MANYKPFICMLSPKDRLLLKTIAERNQTSMAQLIREAIHYTYLNKWVPTEKEDYE